MRALALASIVLALAGCAYEPEIRRPGAATGGAEEPPAREPTGPTSTTPTFTPQGCPVDDPAFCEQAAFVANALVLSDADAVFQLSRPTTVSCAEVDPSRFPQCGSRERLDGYLVGSYQGELFTQPPRRYRDTLAFLVEAVDEEYSDELGGPRMQVLGVSSCGDGSYHLVYHVALGDPDSTLPGTRFLGTYEFTRRDGRWAVGVAHAGLFTDWQLVLDDPLAEIACGSVEPWGARAD